jgi:CO dehydrogenase maturation factor
MLGGDSMKKIAVCGKGGVGKTTFASLLIHTLAEDGRDVYAIDADPNPTLAEALGFSPGTTEKITPIIEMKKLIEERTGAKSGEYGSYFKANPRVKDIPAEYSVKMDNISFLMMGIVRGADKGCACPENAMLKSLMTHLMVKEKETVVVDMVAGTEHMGRGTAKAVDAMIIVVEPGIRSIKAAIQFQAMAADLGVRNIYVVGNKIRTKEDREYIKKHMPGFLFAGFLPLDDVVVNAERQGRALFELSPNMRKLTKDIMDAIFPDTGK